MLSSPGQLWVNGLRCQEASQGEEVPKAELKVEKRDFLLSLAALPSSFLHTSTNHLLFILFDLPETWLCPLWHAFSAIIFKTPAFNRT